MEEVKGTIEKADIVIGNIPDCILELDNRSLSRQSSIPQMPEALAALLNARTVAAVE